MLKFFGTDSAFGEGVNSSSYFTHGNTLFIIDIGENTFSQIKKLIDSKDFEKVCVFITHTHADHVNGLSTLSHYLYYIKKIPLVIKVHESLAYGIEYMMNFNGNNKEQFKIEKTNSQFLVSNEFGNIYFRYVKTNNVDNLECFGIIVGFDKKCCYYSGDSNVIPEEIIRLIENNDINYFYQDISLAHYENNVHMSLETFKNNYLNLFKNKNDVKLYFYHNDKFKGELIDINNI